MTTACPLSRADLVPTWARFAWECHAVQRSPSATGPKDGHNQYELPGAQCCSTFGCRAAVIAPEPKANVDALASCLVCFSRRAYRKASSCSCDAGLCAPLKASGDSLHHCCSLHGAACRLCSPFGLCSKDLIHQSVCCGSACCVRASCFATVQCCDHILHQSMFDLRTCL